MPSTYLFAVGTIGLSKHKFKQSTLPQAARHNRRTIQAELGAYGKIDPTRTALNQTLIGPHGPDDVVEMAQSLMADAGVDVKKLRKDHVQAIELLFSLPLGITVNDDDFFRRCTEWAGAQFGITNILSADVHRDEAVPHCHVLVLPLVDGKMRGSDMVSRKATAALCESFYRDVAKAFGLKRPTGRLKGAERGLAVRDVLNALEERQDPILRSSLWVTVRREIEVDPGRFLEELGLEAQVPARKTSRTMAQIFTSTGKGGRSERQYDSKQSEDIDNPIGFDDANLNPVLNPVLNPKGFKTGRDSGSDQDRTLSCVGFDSKKPPWVESAPAMVQHAAMPNLPARQATSKVQLSTATDCRSEVTSNDANATRHRDNDLAASQWCEELGEFLPNVKPVRKRAAATTC